VGVCMHLGSNATSCLGSYLAVEGLLHHSMSVYPVFSDQKLLGLCWYFLSLPWTAE
jgi:hypothetical protein